MMIREAIAFAEKAHEGQVRRYDNAPYIVHPKEVMSILVERIPRVPEHVLIAAILHDVVEDTKVSLYEVQALFGPHVARLVGEVTEPRHYGDRYARKMAEARRLAFVSPDAQNIKYADILSNIKDIQAKDPSFAKVYLMEKRHAIIRMNAGYAPLRGAVWLKIQELLYAG
jgi:(p)ppGpp synthase/HD superfamily hydrolase